MLHSPADPLLLLFDPCTLVHSGDLALVVAPEEQLPSSSSSKAGGLRWRKRKQVSATGGKGWGQTGGEGKQEEEVGGLGLGAWLRAWLRGSVDACAVLSRIVPG